MNKHQSNLDFRLMAFFFKIRDFFKPPVEKVDKIGLSSGDRVLDYGCGTGSYSVEVARQVGPEGIVYAADIHPLAIKKIQKRAKKQGLSNIHTIQTDCKTGLEEKSIDVVICFDMLHDVSNYQDVLSEIRRVMTEDAVFAFDDHHQEESEILSKFTESRFELKKKDGEQYLFVKSNN